MIRRKQVHPSDFPDGVEPRTDRGYYLPPPVYRTVAIAFEERLLESFTPRHLKRMTVGEYLDEQAMELRAAMVLNQPRKPLFMD